MFFDTEEKITNSRNIDNEKVKYVSNREVLNIEKGIIDFSSEMRYSHMFLSIL